MKNVQLVIKLSTSLKFELYFYLLPYTHKMDTNREFMTENIHLAYVVPAPAYLATGEQTNYTSYKR